MTCIKPRTARKLARRLGWAGIRKPGVWGISAESGRVLVSSHSLHVSLSAFRTVVMQDTGDRAEERRTDGIESLAMMRSSCHSGQQQPMGYGQQPMGYGAPNQPQYVVHQQGGGMGGGAAAGAGCCGESHLFYLLITLCDFVRGGRVRYDPRCVGLA